MPHLKPGFCTPSPATPAVGKVRDLAELPQAFGRCGGGDGVAAQDVEMGVTERGQPAGVLILDREASGEGQTGFWCYVACVSGPSLVSPPL
ncbi:hypothetical protein GCM10023096_40310 [Nonomuraea ferruginea]